MPPPDGISPDSGDQAGERPDRVQSLLLGRPWGNRHRVHAPAALVLGGNGRSAIPADRGRGALRPWIIGSCPAAPWSAWNRWIIRRNRGTWGTSIARSSNANPRCSAPPANSAMPVYAEAVEHLWFNAAQGSRVPDGSGVLYCSPENRLSVDDEIGHRQRFSPTHQQVAVCCNPNATRVAAYYIANIVDASRAAPSRPSPPCSTAHRS